MEMSIKKCVCESKYQDGKLGEKNRYHTIGAKVFTCTVCGRTEPRK